MEAALALGVIITVLGGPPAIASLIYRYGKLNARVDDIRNDLDHHIERDDRAFDELSTLVRNLQHEITDRLARIEERLS